MKRVSISISDKLLWLSIRTTLSICAGLLVLGANFFAEARPVMSSTRYQQQQFGQVAGGGPSSNQSFSLWASIGESTAGQADSQSYQHFAGLVVVPDQQVPTPTPEPEPTVVPTEIPEEYQGHFRTVTSLAVAPDGTRIAAGAIDGRILIWATGHSLPIMTLLHHQQAVNSLAFSEDGQELLSGSSDHSAVLWNISGTTPVPMQVFRNHTGPVRAVLFSSFYESLLTAGDDGVARFWEWGNPFAPIKEFRLPRDNMQNDNNGFTSAVFVSQGMQVVLGAWNGSVSVWEIETGQMLHLLRERSFPVMALGGFPDQTTVVSGDRGGRLFFWESYTEQLLHSWQVHSNIYGIRDLAVSPSGRFVLTGSPNEGAKLWEAHSDAEMLSQYVHDVRAVLFMPTNNHIVLGTEAGKVLVYDISEFNLQPTPTHIPVTVAPTRTPQPIRTPTPSGPQPPPPEQVVATTHLVDQVQITWGLPSLREQISHYNIYRGPAEVNVMPDDNNPETYVRINSFPVRNTYFIDRDVVPGVMIAYWVRAVGANQVQSLPSGPALGMAVEPIESQFSLSCVDDHAEGPRGSVVSYTLMVMSEFGFNQPVQIVATNLPYGFQPQLVPGFITPGSTGYCRITIPAFAEPGLYSFQVLATSAGRTESLDLSLNVLDMSLNEVSLHSNRPAITLGESVVMSGRVVRGDNTGWWGSVQEPIPVSVEFNNQGVDWNEDTPLTPSTSSIVHEVMSLPNGLFHTRFTPPDAGVWNATASVELPEQTITSPAISFSVSERMVAVSLGMSSDSEPVAGDTVLVGGRILINDTPESVALTDGTLVTIRTRRLLSGLPSVATVVTTVYDRQFMAGVMLAEPGMTEIVAAWEGVPGKWLGGMSQPLRFYTRSATAPVELDRRTAGDFAFNPGMALVICGEGDELRDATAMSSFSNNWYRTLRDRRFIPKTRLTYLNEDPNQEIPKNGQVQDDVVDAGSSLASVQQALEDAAEKVAVDYPLSVFVQSTRAEPGGVLLGNGDRLEAQTLRAMLADKLSEEVPVRLIVDMPDGGAYAQDLVQDATQWIAIASVQTGQPIYLSGGDISFGAGMSTVTALGYDIASAYHTTRSMLRVGAGGPIAPSLPRIYPENAGVNQHFGLTTMETDLLAPEVQSLSAPQQVPPHTSARVDAVVVDDIAVHRVYALVYPPTGTVMSQDLTATQQENQYELTLDGFSELGLYRVVVFAEDTSGNISQPKQTELDIAVNLDLNGDGFINYLDLFLLVNYWHSDSGVGDFNQDGITDQHDLLLLLRALID